MHPFYFPWLFYPSNISQSNSHCSSFQLLKKSSLPHKLYDISFCINLINGWRNSLFIFLTLLFCFFKWYPEEKIKYPRTPSAFRSRQKKHGFFFLPPCESFISMEVTFLWFPWVLPSWSNHYLFQILTIQNLLVTLKLWWLLAEG